MKKIVTAESVCQGHPDKLCDLIADGILDACLRVDENPRVACEVMASNKDITVAGEITCNGVVDYYKEIKDVLSAVGYDPEGFFIDTNIHKQSADIDGGVTKGNDEIGAGDQGVVYGYACDETDESLPLPVVLANRICRYVDNARKHGVVDFLNPDGKCLVGVEYENGKPVRIDSVVLSVQHTEDCKLQQIKDLWNYAILPNVFDDIRPDGKTTVMINPSGRFVIGGPEGDTGLTGRKLMCDTYGGIAHHGGGAFSGKDATKVDRSGAYYARYVAKNIVAADFARKCEVCITYAIGKEEPISVDIDTFGTGKVSDEKLANAVVKVFDFRPKAIIEQLDLRSPIFFGTTSYGHFGKDGYIYEKTDKVDALKEAVANA